ncbi:MAG TPA: metallophosphoesterase, partial [Woeseiaceae bacterium]|nr:metallophosphoesterase [Woeseiaceae bacterium]
MQTPEKPLLALVALLAFAPAAWADEWHYDNVERVVAIADIHGAFDAMTATLEKAKILDDDLNWSGGKAHLVVVGDILDRGPGSRRAMELLMRLESEAETAGGRVHVLFGNHETMPMTGDLRYVSDAEYAAFADDEDPAERSRWLRLFAKRNGSDVEVVRERFDREFPPGYFAMRRAFRADGRYGKWLLQKNIIVVINGTAFVHG